MTEDVSCLRMTIRKCRVIGYHRDEIDARAQLLATAPTLVTSRGREGINSLIPRHPPVHLIRIESASWEGTGVNATRGRPMKRKVQRFEEAAS